MKKLINSQSKKKMENFIWANLRIRTQETVFMWYTMEYYSAIEKNDILPFAATWIDLEGILLSEIRQTEKTNTVWYHLYVEYKKHNKLVNVT